MSSSLAPTLDQAPPDPAGAPGPHVVGPLPTPAALLADLPASPGIARQVRAHRAAVRRVLGGTDDRLLVVVGPCSVHDPAAGLDYARRLAASADRFGRDLLVVLRAHVEKPRSVVGWKGLAHDPALDGSGDLATGLRTARAFLLDAASTGLPLATEFVEPLVAPYVADLVSWGAIGARTVASQPHRQLASWLPMPVGCKNGTGGDVAPALDAVRAARVPHTFPGLDAAGQPVVLRGAGNPDAHVVLRGGSAGPNYDAASVGQVLRALRAAGLPARLVVDASHGNSGKDHRRQPAVAAALADQVAAGCSGIAGVMVESFLAEGRQDLVPGAPLRYGVSVTDACLGWGQTGAVLDRLAAAARARREVAGRG
jgi:3-deoxy-7-phosphoheptulonate synthase